MKALLLFLVLTSGLCLRAQEVNPSVSQPFHTLSVKLRATDSKPEVLTVEIENTGTVALTVYDPYNAEVITLSGINSVDLHQHLKLPDLVKEPVQEVVLEPKSKLRVDIDISWARESWRFRMRSYDHESSTVHARLFLAYWPAGKSGPMLLSNFIPIESKEPTP